MVNTSSMGMRNERIHCIHELEDLRGPRLVAFEGFQGRHPDDGRVVARVLVLVQQLAHFEVDQVEQLLVVDRVGLVEGHDDEGDAHLAGQQHVLTGLGHGAVGRRHHQDGAVDLGRAGDHVLDVVGVARHVDVGVVALGSLVLDVGDGDRDAPRLLLRRLVDLVERGEGGGGVLVVEDLGDGRGQRGLAVVDVTHRAHVEVRLRAVELLLRHMSP
jgi:hypothetical protein